MDFARKHVIEESVTTRSKIEYLPPTQNDDNNKDTQEDGDNSQESLEELWIEELNRSTTDIFLGDGTYDAAVDQEMKREEQATSNQADETERRRIRQERLHASLSPRVDCRLYPERSLPSPKENIKTGDLVVIMINFNNLSFVYAEENAIFSNRNGHFHHNDFIGKPFGCKVRTRDNHGIGFCYLLRPTPELWTRSLPHRTQVVHELDQSQVVWRLHLKPNAVVVESGTGSGAMSHSLLRTIAPAGHLHTYEFNAARVAVAQKEFLQHGLSHLVTVRHKDVCGKHGQGGFDLAGQSVDACFLDLPEPWLAIPHAAYCLKAGARICTYSPCIEQTQRSVEALKRCGFHSMQTLEFRNMEYYVDEVEYDACPPREKRPRFESHVNPHLIAYNSAQQAAATGNGNAVASEDGNNEAGQAANVKAAPEVAKTAPTETADAFDGPFSFEASSKKTTTSADAAKKKNTMLVARPFTLMRGHTAFLTFATAGNILQLDPNQANGADAKSSSSSSEQNAIQGL